ncbi:hypothetical protein IT084_01500 [Desulfallas sp. Bu1-1]|nr:hypothetical protein [Desulfallas sp. Bu1-1]MBF7081658.1 hypothetical protein [Desulfallas sp. Bu1-1]
MIWLQKLVLVVGAPAVSSVRFAILPLWLEQLLVNAYNLLPNYFFTP